MLKYSGRSLPYIDSSYEAGFSREKRYPLSHSVGNHMPASTMLNPVTAIRPFQYISEPIHDEYATSWNNFNSTPTIPHYTMPHEEQLRGRFSSQGHLRSSRPRFVTVWTYKMCTWTILYVTAQVAMIKFWCKFFSVLLMICRSILSCTMPQCDSICRTRTCIFIVAFISRLKRYR